MSHVMNAENRFRRQFLIASVGAAALSAHSWVAARAPNLDTEFRVLPKSVPTADPNKIEVLEFFWYGCSHCAAFEPTITAWKAKVASDVAFKTVHVSWAKPEHQQFALALEALKRQDLDRKVFDWIHVSRKPLNTYAQMLSFIKEVGVDPLAFESAYKSFSMPAAMKRGKELTEAYKVDGVPQVAVNGRYITSPAMTNGRLTRTIEVIENLIDLERQSGKK